MDSGATRRYIIPILSKALDILELLEKQSGSATPEALQRWTGISQSTVYRILRTLVHRGYVVRSETGGYRLVSRPRKLRFGLCSWGTETTFTSSVLHSVREASLNAGVDLVVSFDSGTQARLVRPRVDLMILFQIDPEMGPMIAHLLSTEGVAIIAVDTPIPHATYFGLDHYSVGIDMGAHLARHAATQWHGERITVLGLGSEAATPLYRNLIAGTFEGVHTVLPDLPSRAFIRAQGERDCAGTTAEFLHSLHPGEKLLIAAGSDIDGMHALAAARSLGRQKDVAILSCGCTADTVSEMRDPSSPWIGSVSLEANLYGSIVIDLGLSILRGNKVQPYNFVPHRLITAAGLRGRIPSAKAEYPVGKSTVAEDSA